MVTVDKMTETSDNWVKTHPIITDEAILIPKVPYVKEGMSPLYSTLITKELFIEAYKKWILNDNGGVLDEQK